MQRVSKAIVSTMVAGALALGSASPAMARDRDRGIGTSELLAGALVIGGIAAVAAAASSNNRRGDHSRYNDHRYSTRGYQHDAVSMCVRAAEQTAARSYRANRAEVYQIRDVDRRRNNVEVKGRIAVQDRGRNYRNARWNEGNFTCQVRNGRVSALNFRGIRGL